MTELDLTAAITAALAQPGAERLREWNAIGPVQRAALHEVVAHVVAAMVQPNEPVASELAAELAKATRCAIGYSDVIANHCMAMQAAVIDGKLRSPAHGLQWIVNTLDGPGLLPDLADAQAIGGAQAWFDREAAKHEEFRAQHPAPQPAPVPQPEQTDSMGMPLSCGKPLCSPGDHHPLCAKHPRAQEGGAA